MLNLRYGWPNNSVPVFENLKEIASHLFSSSFVAYVTKRMTVPRVDSGLYASINTKSHYNLPEKSATESKKSIVGRIFTRD